MVAGYLGIEVPPGSDSHTARYSMYHTVVDSCGTVGEWACAKGRGAGEARTLECLNDDFGYYFRVGAPSYGE